MYPHFIEVHDGDQTMIVNIDKIGIVKDMLIMVEHPTRWQPVDESYDEIKKLITDSGSLIKMGDPRLDNKPLTMEDLKGMIGEPVWDANTGHWYLVSEIVSDDYRGNVVSLRTHDGGCWYYDASDLIAKPLYRMRQ